MIHIILLISILPTTILAELEFVVHLRLGDGNKTADSVAAWHNMTNLGEIMEDSGLFLLRTVENTRHRRCVADLTNVFVGEEEVDWFEHQARRKRVKRNAINTWNCRGFTAIICCC